MKLIFVRDKLKNILFSVLNNSKKRFIFMLFLSSELSRWNRWISSWILFLITSLIIFGLFLFYTIRRFGEYRNYKSANKSRQYVLFDNVPLFIGIVGTLLMEKFYYSKNQHEVNFIHIFLFVLACIPTFIGYSRLEEFKKTS